MKETFTFVKLPDIKINILVACMGKIDNENFDKGSFFKLAKSVFLKGTNVLLPTILSQEGLLLTDEKAKANALSSFYH